MTFAQLSTDNNANNANLLLCPEDHERQTTAPIEYGLAFKPSVHSP